MMLVRNSSGKRQPAVILALIGPTMRVALKDSDDVEEYRLVNQTWSAASANPSPSNFRWAYLKHRNDAARPRVPHTSMRAK